MTPTANKNARTQLEYLCLNALYLPFLLISRGGKKKGSRPFFQALPPVLTAVLCGYFTIIIDVASNAPFVDAP